MKLINIIKMQRYDKDGVPVVLLGYIYYRNQRFGLEKFLTSMKYKQIYKNNSFGEYDDAVVLKEKGFIDGDTDAFLNNMQFSLTTKGKELCKYIEYLESSENESEYNKRLIETRMKFPALFETFGTYFDSYDEMVKRKTNKT